MRSVTKTCDECHSEYDATRASSRYCSTRCRVAAHRRRNAPSLDSPDAHDASPVPVGDLAAMAADPLTAPWVPSMAASLDEQVAQAVVEGRALTAAFERLSREARDNYAGRCGKVAQALREALNTYFGGTQ